MQTKLSFLQNSYQPDNSFFYVVDAKLKKLYPGLFDNLNAYYFDAFEGNKNFEHATKICNFLLKHNVARTNKIVAIGGGITLDIAAFCANIYKRGCKLILVPTTVLAMVDASIGGKTAINFNGLKNMLGTFYPANEVIFDYSFINTLEKKELQNGWAELIKTMILANKTDFTFNSIIPDFEDIQFCAKFKFKVCEQDLTDKNYRHILNFGHTVAHLIESCSNYKIPHGKAVAFGMLCMLAFSAQKKLCEKLIFEQLEQFLFELDFDFCEFKSIIAPIKEKGFDILKQDKKGFLKLVVIANKKPIIFAASVPDIYLLIEIVINLIKEKC